MLLIEWIGRGLHACRDVGNGVSLWASREIETMGWNITSRSDVTCIF